MDNKGFAKAFDRQEEVGSRQEGVSRRQKK